MYADLMPAHSHCYSCRNIVYARCMFVCAEEEVSHSPKHHHGGIFDLYPAAAALLSVVCFCLFCFQVLSQQEKKNKPKRKQGRGAD